MAEARPLHGPSFRPRSHYGHRPLPPFPPLRSAFATALVALTAQTLPAQIFIGSDNFNDNTLTAQIVNGANSGLPQAAGQWRFSTPNANGTGNAWTETNQRMEFTTSNTTALNRGFLGWSSPTSSTTTLGATGLTTGLPYTSSWTSLVTVTNNATVASSGFTSAGYEIYTTNATNTDSNAYYGINVAQSFGASNITLEWGKWNGTAFTTTASSLTLDTTTAVILRLTYDGATKVLTTDYSKNGGASFLTGASYDLDGAQIGLSAPGLNGFGLELYASASAGNAINAGQVSFDNFSVSAIPEPSTYAALAGLGALGLALWHKRRTRAA